MVCEKCQSQMEVQNTGSTQGLYCTKCDWSVVTTHISEIRLDATKYEIRIREGDYRNEQHVKAVAHVSGMNFFLSRKLLQESLPIVFKGETIDIVRARESLVSVGMECVISPDFCW